VVAIPIVRTDLVQTLVASGHIETPFRVSIGSQITGVVTRIPVTEGQAVRQGDTLLLLDATEARALDVQANGQLAQAAARMRQLRELSLPSAVQALAEAKATLLSMQQAVDRNLAVAGFDTPASRDAAQANVDVARTHVRTAELQVATNGVGGSDYRVAETQFSQARANLDAARSRTGYRVVTAPRAGVLISRDVEVGDVVQPGKELMLLSPAGDVDIVVQIDERNLGLIAVGQSALASADAYAKQSFPATVVFINPAVDVLRASVEVKLRVPAPPTYLRQDMTMSVDIEAKRHAQTLVVETSDVHDAATSHPWLMLARSGRARRQAVTLGIVSGGSAEILSGASAGDLVVPASASAATDGHRIRVSVRPPPAVAVP
jgi:HlyD family secretion protein